MKNLIKGTILKFISKEKVIEIIRKLNFFKNYTAFFQNFYVDAKLFYKYSAIYRMDTYEKMETKIILRYHSIEKGLIHKVTKPKFAKDKVKDLEKLLASKLVTENNDTSQVQVAIKILIRYYEVHQDLKIDIGEYYSESLYGEYKNRISKIEPSFKGVVEFDRDSFYSPIKDDFYKFSNSRKSVRSFTGEKVSEELIKDAVKLSLNAPSVCNRQASKVYLLDDEEKIQKVLKIQGGFSGFSQHVKQLLIVTSNRSYFYTLGERNQFYIDGGIYLLNLLYSLHYYKIANCPANWGKRISDEKKLNKIISIPESEKIICLVPIGNAEQEFSVPLSKRREVDEMLYKL